jgi:hypothetical protein
MLIFVKIDFLKYFFLKNKRFLPLKKCWLDFFKKWAISTDSPIFVLIQEVLQIEKTKMYINKVQCRKLISIVQACK